ncbi:MAG TPA: Smr/MutS family protein [Bryobacteraceae bacterium]|jgi:DNA mismatch repair protein MutS2|nr:Smr/MutS family protein [Bryobacteraceae bacterium]
MQHSSAGVLEFEALRSVLGRYVHTPLGRTCLREVQPRTDRDWIEETLAETGEALAYVRLSEQAQPAKQGAAIRIRFESLDDPAAVLNIVRIEGAVLDGLQLLGLILLLELGANVRGVLQSASARFPRLARKAAAISDLRPLVREIRGKILPDGSLSDDASVALGRLRREIEKQQKQIETSLEGFLRAHREDGTLREDFITIRNDRFVVPVVAGQQRKVEGVIHGASGSGQTLFVEPLNTIALNNELVRLREEEAREQHRILREWTQRLRPEAGTIAQIVSVLGELELLFAKADFAADFDCVIPALSPPGSRRLWLDKARHPLLQDILRRHNKPVIPISLELNETRRTLLISGPNTGGKTVTMKTAGLLTLMAQAGIPVPAAGAEFPVFDRVLADIGDNQSIQESLSSFSAHITHLRDMLAEATADTLVLLDELGRATDPEEGGALGVAILDSFLEHRAFALASTHLLALKVYGANTTGVLNGSMGFDEATLEPTYLLRLGAPGKSAGLDIATRLGMPPRVIEKARSVMSTEQRDIARFLSELEERIERARTLESDLAARLAALELQEKSLAAEWAKREAAKLKDLESRFDAKVASFDAQARQAMDEITRQASQHKAAEQAQRRVAKAKREMREEFERAVLPPRAESPGVAIEEGSRVRLKGVRDPARVRRKLAGGRLEVEAGMLKMQVSEQDVEEVLAPSQGNSLPRNISFQPAGPTWDVSYREINVIGQRAEEAVEQVDKFLDNASMASVDRVRVVHGHGMGILRKAITALLASNPHVARFYPATRAEGGTGATVAELK